MWIRGAIPRLCDLSGLWGQAPPGGHGLKDTPKSEFTGVESQAYPPTDLSRPITQHKGHTGDTVSTDTAPMNTEPHTSYIEILAHAHAHTCVHSMPANTRKDDTVMPGQTFKHAA